MIIWNDAVVSAAKMSDYAEILDIETACLDGPGSEKKILKALEENRCLKAECAGAAVGFLLFEKKSPGNCFAARMCVHPLFKDVKAAENMLLYLREMCEFERCMGADFGAGKSRDVTVKKDSKLPEKGRNSRAGKPRRGRRDK